MKQNQIYYFIKQKTASLGNFIKGGTKMSQFILIFHYKSDV